MRVNCNYEAMRRSLELAATMQDGIEHIRARFAEGRFEEMLPLLQDVTRAFISVQQALYEDMTPGCFVDHQERIQRGLNQLVAAYEQMDWDYAVKALEYKVVPGFRCWKAELERRYRHHVIS